MQMQEVLNFHTITNNTPSTTGSISSTSNQCAWWAVQASWPGMVWFLMSVRPSLLLLLPFSLPPPPEPPHLHSTPPPCDGDRSKWHGLSLHTGAALWIISLCGTKSQRWEREWKDFFFPLFFTLHPTQYKANIPSCVLFFHSPNNQHLSASAPLTLTGDFDSCWLNSLCLQRVQNKEVEEIYQKASRLLSLFNYSDVKS